MANPNGFPVLGSRKESLPPGWEERISKKHPDKPYFFNTITHEKRWTSPLEAVKANETKGNKRKIDSEGDDESDASMSAANKLSISQRPKLKARGQKKDANNPGKSLVDTPLMRQLREKLAQKKALEAQKKQKTVKLTPKRPENTNQTLTEENVSQVPESTTPLRRTRRRSSMASSTESAFSDKSTVSNASSLGSKIKVAASIPEERVETNNSSPIVISKLPKIPLLRVSPNTLKANCLESIKSSQDSPQTYAQKNFAQKRLERLRRSLVSEKDKKSAAPSNDDNSLAGTSRSSGTCLANERLKRLRQSLSSECSPNKKVAKLSSARRSISPITKSKLKSPLPNLLKEAPNRIYSLENRIQNEGLLEIIKSKSLKIDEEDDVKNIELLEKIMSSDNCEEMEWEPIEDEKIMSEVQSVRFQLCENPAETPSNFSCNTLQSTATESSALYIVIDTNVFLSNLSFVEEVRDSHSDIYGRPFIVVPWTVLQELDYMKEDRNNVRSQALKLKAKKAVDFLNRHFSNKHPRFLGQTPTEVENNKTKFEIDCPDDEILQTCLQIKDASKTPVLLSYDKNLGTKAMIYDIVVLGRDEPLEKIYFLKAAETTDFISNSLHENIKDDSEEISLTRKEVLEAEDIMELGREVFKTLLSEIVSKEMEKLFGQEWEKYVIIKPPWTLEDVFKCVFKHWMAAISEVFPYKDRKKIENKLKDVELYLKYKKSASGIRKLEDVKFFLEKCNDITQALNESSYPELKFQILRDFDTLRLRCLEVIEKLSNARLREAVGSAETTAEEKRRSSLAFKVIEDIYSFARDSCGIAASALGLPCSFIFNKDHSGITDSNAIQNHKDIGVSLKKLVDILRMVLLKMDEDLYPNHKSILSLHEALVNFSYDANHEEIMKLAPLDVYCCVKLRKTELEKGYEQLQEVLMHFCHMANVECK